MHEAFKGKRLRVNETKTKIMMTRGNTSQKQVQEFVNLVSLVKKDSRFEDDIERRVKAGNNVDGARHVFIYSHKVEKATLIVHQGVS